MLVITGVLVGVFALTSSLTNRRDHKLISRRPYENVREGMPRSARSTTPLDLS